MNHETMLQSRRRPRRSSTPVTIQKERLCGTPGNATTKVLFGLFPSGPGRECGPTHGGHSVWEEFHPNFFLSVNTPLPRETRYWPKPQLSPHPSLVDAGSRTSSSSFGKKKFPQRRARGGGDVRSRLRGRRQRSGWGRKDDDDSVYGDPSLTATSDGRDSGYPQGSGQAGGDGDVVFSPEALIPFGGRLLASESPIIPFTPPLLSRTC
jgi:hypothetical protein